MSESAPSLLPPLPPEPGSLIGRQLGDYTLERLIGMGGMGEVYLAQQISLPRAVALKILRFELSRDEQYLRRFRTEAKAIAPISHPHIVSVYSIGEQDGLHFIAFEYVRGINLRQYIDRHGPLEEETALRIAMRVTSAIQQASEAGIIHRDIKPENVLITRRGEVKVADFGLARQVGGEDVRLTQTGVTMGTPLYMSPEQIQGNELDARSDLYSLGVMCYHMLAGEPPFRGETAMAVAIKHVHGVAEPLQEIRPDVKPEFLAIIARMMAKKPEDRYESPGALLTDLERLQAGDTHLIKPWPGFEDITRNSRRRRTVLQRIRSFWRQTIWAATHPPYQHWFMAGSLVIALAAGGGVAYGVKRMQELPQLIPDIKEIPTQESGFMQFTYARTAADDSAKERALWAVLIKYPGDDKYTIRAAQDLVDKYLAEERFASLDMLARYMIDREDVTQQTYGYLIRGLALSRQGKAEQAEESFSSMQSLAVREEWGGEPLDWLARKYFLAKRVDDIALGHSPEQTEKARQDFWRAFNPPSVAR